LPGTLYSSIARMLGERLIEEVPAPRGQDGDARPSKPLQTGARYLKNLRGVLASGALSFLDSGGLVLGHVVRDRHHARGVLLRVDGDQAGPGCQTPLASTFGVQGACSQEGGTC